MIPIVRIARDPQLAESDVSRCFKLSSLLDVAMSVSPFACASVVREKVEELVRSVIKFIHHNPSISVSLRHCQWSNLASNI